MTYSLEETGKAIDGSNDVAHNGKQKLRQPKLNQTALRVALATAQQQAAEAQHRLDELRAIVLDLRQERRCLARPGAEAGSERKTNGQAARVVALGHERLMRTLTVGVTARSTSVSKTDRSSLSVVDDFACAVSKYQQGVAASCPLLHQTPILHKRLTVQASGARQCVAQSAD
jgi:hypothetical protein